MHNLSIAQSTLQAWIESLVAKTTEWLLRLSDSRGVRSPHFWIITALMAVLTLLYYAGHTPLAHFGGFLTCTYPHDIHRALFLFPIIYAAVAFRGRGALSTSLLFLCVVLPRPFFCSPYADPLVRSLLFVIFAALLSLLIATQLNRLESEKEARTGLSFAYRELAKWYDKLRESQEQLVQAEKLSSLGQMAASIAHEVNNPLSGVLLYVELLIRRIKGNSITKMELVDYLSKMQVELVRSTRLVRNLLDFARQSPPMLSEVDLNEVIDQAFDLTAHLTKLQHIQVVKELDSSLPRVMGDFDQLRQVCANLVLNAIQAMPEGGRLTLRTSTTSDGQLKLGVQDTGYGISPENMGQLFTPFFTTKEKGKGVGLGLAVSHGIIQRHHGRIDVQSRVGEGTTFTVYLPLRQEEHEES